MVKLATVGSTRRNIFGDLALVPFLLAQASDGVLTYVGISTFGASIEANPLIGWLMATIGHGPALAAAKLTASTFGIALHLIDVHMFEASGTAAAQLKWKKPGDAAFDVVPADVLSHFPDGTGAYLGAYIVSAAGATGANRR